MHGRRSGEHAVGGDECQVALFGECVRHVLEYWGWVRSVLCCAAARKISLDVGDQFTVVPEDRLLFGHAQQERLK